MNEPLLTSYTELNKLIYQYFKERQLGNEKPTFAITDEQQNLSIFSYTLQTGWVQQYNTKPFLDDLKRYKEAVDAANLAIDLKPNFSLAYKNKSIYIILYLL